MRHNKNRRRLGYALAAFAVSLVGCTGISVKVGEVPDVGNLESRLLVGSSTKSEVQRILGKPYGTGRSLLPMEKSPKTLWTYYYEESSLEDTRRIFLWVFFDEELYSGHMWFSSLPSN
jgi:hypothetical protein